MSETRLRELLREYAADEPPLRLRAVEVMHPPRAGWRRPLAAAAAAVIVGGGAVAFGVTRANHGLTPVATPTSTGTTLGAGQRVGNQTPAGQMLAVMRELGVAAYPSATEEVLDHLTSWVPDSLGVPRVARPSDATEWLVETHAPGGRSGLRVSARLLPPDTPASQRTASACPPGADPARCTSGTLPDGRAWVERVVYGSGWPELAPNEPVHRRELTVYDGNVEVAVTEIVRNADDHLDDVPWVVPVDTLRDIAADPRLVPPVPDPLPPLPSYLLCRVYPPAPGCPGFTAVSGVATSAAPTSVLPIAGQPIGSGALAVTGLPAAQVLDRIRTRAAELLGPGLTETSHVVSNQSQPLSAVAWARATSVQADFFDATKQRVLSIRVSREPSSWTAPCEPSGSEPDCQSTLRADGTTEVYHVDLHPDFHPPLEVRDVVGEATFEVNVWVGYTDFTGATAAPADLAALTPTHVQLSRVANDTGLRLAAPAPR